MDVQKLIYAVQFSLYNGVLLLHGARASFVMLVFDNIMSFCYFMMLVPCCMLLVYQYNFDFPLYDVGLPLYEACLAGYNTRAIS